MSSGVRLTLVLTYVWATLYYAHPAFFKELEHVLNEGDDGLFSIDFFSGPGAKKFMHIFLWKED